MWFSTSTTTLSPWHTWMLGPGIILFAVKIPRSTPSARTHWHSLHTELVAFGVHTWHALKISGKFASTLTKMIGQTTFHEYSNPLIVLFIEKMSAFQSRRHSFKKYSVLSSTMQFPINEFHMAQLKCIYKSHINEFTNFVSVPYRGGRNCSAMSIAS